MDKTIEKKEEKRGNWMKMPRSKKKKKKKNGNKERMMK